MRDGGTLTIVDEGERVALRRAVARRLGFDAEKPTIAVFAHAQSDALWSNVQAFPDFTDWLDGTAGYAAGHPEANWLFLDHPSQFRYDRTDYFGKVAARHAEDRHIAFRPSLALRKNALWSLVDLAVTVRGSVSNEFPGLGVPALQAGWSEWSHLGFTQLAESPDEYFAALDADLKALAAGRSLISRDQVERARLWHWFYRSGADVPTPYLAHFQAGASDLSYFISSVATNNIESDADPGLVAIRRLWLNKEPFLTRIDFAGDLSRQIAPVVDPSDMSIPAYPLCTRFDPEHTPLHGATCLSSGESSALLQADGLVRGRAVVGRFTAADCLCAIAYTSDVAGGEVRARLRVSIDGATDGWRRNRLSDLDKESPDLDERYVLVVCEQKPVALLHMDADRPRATAEFTCGPQAATGVIVLEFVGVVPNGDDDNPVLPPGLLSGVQLHDIEFDPGERRADVPQPVLSFEGRTLTASYPAGETRGEHGPVGVEGPGPRVRTFALVPQ